MSFEPTTVILPLDLGSADKYDQHVFPLAYHGINVNNFDKGSLLLSATLEEMVKIKELGIDLSRNEEFLFNTRIKYEILAAKRAKLQKSQKTLNPFKSFLNYRAARLFHAASLTLYRETRETSEKMQRDKKLIQTVPSAEMHAVDNPVPTGAAVVGIAIKLTGPVDDDTIQTISDATDMITSFASNPFTDNPLIPQLNDEDEIVTLADTESILSHLDAVDDVINEDTQTQSIAQSQKDPTNPTSPQTINHIHIYHNSVVTSNSSVSGLTVNRGSGDSGAFVSQ